MSTFTTYKLVDLFDLVGGGTPKTTESDYWNGDIPWISVVDFNGDKKFIFKTEKTITQRGLVESSTKLLNKGDIIISARGTVGELGVLTRPMAFNQSCYGIKAKPITSNAYLYYLLQLKITELKNHSHGSVFSTITRNTFENISADIPDKRTQHRIAEILSCLDDKIELNRQMNQTLEKMAQAMFKHQFVDGIDPENLPEGWQEDLIGKFIDSVSVTHSFPKSDVIFLNTSDILNGVFLTHDYSVVENLPGQAKKSLRKHDILYSEIRPANKRFAYVNFEAEDYVVSTKLMVLRAKDYKLSKFFYFYLTQDSILKHLQNLAESRSGTFPQITFDQISELKFPMPKDNAIHIFTEKIINPFFDLQWSNNIETESLVKIRDGLIPKLISGEILPSDLKQVEHTI